MIAALMVYVVLVSTLVGICAVGAEWLARRAGIPVRPVWAGAMLVTLGFIGLAPYRGSPAPTTMPYLNGPEQAPGIASVARSSSWTTIAQRVAGIQRNVILAPISRSIGFVQRLLPAPASNYLIALWLIASASLLLLMIGVYLRFRRERRQWPIATMCGVDVRVAPDVGPAVIGVVRPDIVVPRWLLERSDDEQRLVIAHETEHTRTRDPMLLAFGCAAAAILPWNPAAWWMLSRLRLAVELDCDARVLSGGVAPRKYGDLLIDLAEHRSGFRVSVAALVDDSSHLEQRLIAMKPDFPKYARTRAVVVSALAIASLLVACETAVPTSADVAKMDVVSAERGARSAFMMKTSEPDPIYTIDNAVVSAAVAKALSPDKIGSIDMVRSSDGKRAEVHILSARHGGQLLLNKTAVNTSEKKFDGLLLVDGVKTPIGSIDMSDNKSIASVKITKPPVDWKQYGDPLAANGVISITTKAKTAQ